MQEPSRFPEQCSSAFCPECGRQTRMILRANHRDTDSEVFVCPACATPHSQRTEDHPWGRSREHAQLTHAKAE